MAASPSLSKDVIFHCAACLRERGLLISYAERQTHCVLCQSAPLEPLELHVERPALPTIHEVLADRASSHWIKHALMASLSRDPVDAANDAELLARVLDARCRELLSRS